MGVGRREFLRIAGVALTGLAVNPLQAVVTNENLYLNKKLGILFYKPVSWGFVAVKDFGKLKKDQILAGQSNEIKDEIFDDYGFPICIATKYFHDYTENQGVFSPSISLHITPKEELENLGHQGFEEIMRGSEIGTAMILKDFKVIKRYDPFILSGSKFYEIDAEYMFEHVEIHEPLKVELKVLRTKHNDFYYDFNCHQSLAQNQTASNEFEEFKKTIKLI